MFYKNVVAYEVVEQCIESWLFYRIFLTCYNDGKRKYGGFVWLHWEKKFLIIEKMPI